MFFLSQFWLRFAWLIFFLITFLRFFFRFYRPCSLLKPPVFLTPVCGMIWSLGLFISLLRSSCAGLYRAGSKYSERIWLGISFGVSSTAFASWLCSLAVALYLILLILIFLVHTWLVLHLVGFANNESSLWMAIPLQFPTLLLVLAILHYKAPGNFHPSNLQL